MVLSNYERVGKALELLKQGLAPYIERELQSRLDPKEMQSMILQYTSNDRMLAGKGISQWDVAALLHFMWVNWNDLFNRTLGNAERSLVSELKDTRNRWAHQSSFSSDDAYRALDSIHRLLVAISAEESIQLEKMKGELLRIRFEEQQREEHRKAGSLIGGTPNESLKPWREIITPHRDVASGSFQQAEFAADLWQVYLGEGSDEYRDPKEFFRRTYLTVSLRNLLIRSLERIMGSGGDPVVQLQTNFGGGKTHSMLALYHLFSGTDPHQLTGIGELLQVAKVSRIPPVHRVVLVGNKISPGNPSKKPDGTIVRTLWGELAWQLGGKKAYNRIALDDERATNPGDTLRKLLLEYNPCLILIDEWVAYARQLHDKRDLPAGDFETHFTFAQALTESVKAVKNCLLVISLPTSDTSSSTHTLADDAEVGGERGREALVRLRNIVGRVESSWRPASAEEGFEIVRRRLFEPMTEPDQFIERDRTARAFAMLYQTQSSEFPPECKEASYEQRIKAAYPIHPEVFDRLYTDWSTLLKFQRTRGVLRLMATVIHCLWVKGDKNPLILPASLPIDDPRVQFELTRYLSDNWVPIIEKDVDGPASIPVRIDAEVPNLGKYSATRRVARTIYLGSAPITDAAHHGIEDRRIKLGCIMPGEQAAVFGDALRRLSSAATYLFQDGVHYWYSTQPTVTSLAEDRSEQFRRNRDAVVEELNRRLREALKDPGDFKKIHALPHGSQDIPDERDTRLIVLGSDFPYTKDTDCPALREVQQIFEFRGSQPRLYKNSLVFLAPDQSRLQDLEDAICKFLAWKSIIADKDGLNLTPQQVTQATQQLHTANTMVSNRIPETYIWVLVPVQPTPRDPIRWEKLKVSGQEPLAVRVSKKLRTDELLIIQFAPSRLRMELDRIPLWRGNHVSLQQLADDFAQYVYLPRLLGTHVLVQAVKDGLGLPSWVQDSFAWADSWDETTGRYRGLRITALSTLPDSDGPGLLVKPEVARVQLEKDQGLNNGASTTTSEISTETERGHSIQEKAGGESLPQKPLYRRFYGTVYLDPERVIRDAGNITNEILSHLLKLPQAKVVVSLDIHADLPEGVPESVVRIVTENARTLRFTSQAFEE